MVSQLTKKIRYPKLINAEIDTYLLRKNLIPQTVERSANKEFLYFIAFFVSVLFLGFSFFIANLSETDIEFYNQVLNALPIYDFKISQNIINDLKPDKPVMGTLFAGNFLFLGFILIDLFRKEEIKSDGSKDLFKESSSASFALHVLVLLLIVTSLLLTWHPRPQVKVTSIEFVPTQTPSQKKPPKTVTRKANKQSIDAGKNDPKKKVSPQTSQGGKPSLPSAQPKPAEPKPGPKAALPKPKPITQPPAPSPAPAQQPVPSPAPSAPRPIAAPRPKAIRDAVLPLDGSATQTKALPRLMDYGSSSSSDSRSGSTGVPAPKTSSQSGAGGTRGNDLVSRLSSIPRAPDALSGSGTGGAYGTPGNPPPNAYPNQAPSLAAQAELNMGPYMAALQRKIKRAWKPPRGTESNRIVANFKVHRDGSITDLKLIVQCSYPEANLAALEAISNAAPFDLLPAGSVDPVDIEFTFDYNVFQKARW
jgi:outer membrane biosynthesis protein TonB